MFFFDIYPYIAGSVFRRVVAGYVTTTGQYTRGGFQSDVDAKNEPASNLFHIGILGIFAGHSGMLTTPH